MRTKLTCTTRGGGCEMYAQDRLVELGGFNVLCLGLDGGCAMFRCASRHSPLAHRASGSV